MQTNTRYEIIEIDNKEVTFDMSNLASSKSLYINATEIGKQFNKRPSNWLKTAETKEYIDAVCRCSNMSNGELIEVKQGGSHQGTWLHNKLFIAYARWLNPIFAVECDNRIQSILEGNSLPQEQNILPVLVEMAKVNQMLVQSNQEIVANLTNMNAGLHEMLATMHNIKHDTSRIKEDMKVVSGGLAINATQVNHLRHKINALSPILLDKIRDTIETRANELSDGTKTNIQSITRAIYSYINNEFDVSSYYYLTEEQTWKALSIIKNINIGVQNA